ncbi:uncharacterized protein METZ01_LOCUS246034, partial [marine metagenome]
YLQTCFFPDSSFTNCRMRSVSAPCNNFDKASMNNIDFGQADLYRARFNGASLREVSFIDSELGQSNFSNTRMEAVSFEGASIPFANFHAVAGTYELSKTQERMIFGTDEKQLEAESSSLMTT